MQKSKSIYRNILSHLSDECLPVDFCLPAETEPVDGAEAVRLADGAMDGIYVYHMLPEPISAAGMKKLIHALRAGAAGDDDRADCLFAELGRDFPAINIVDDLQDYVVSHAEKLPPERMFVSALSILLYSSSRESIKFALELMELLQVNDEQTKTVIRRLGLCDEFTVFAAWAMRKWENGNDEVFHLIQKVQGWGRIQTLEVLEPETEEIRRWILAHGVENRILPGYSALCAWKKSGAGEMLKHPMSYKTFEQISAIFDGLLDESVASGISELDDAEEIAQNYLNAAAHFTLRAENYQVILALNDWAADDAIGLTDLAQVSQDILSSEECLIAAQEALEKGRCKRLAEALGLLPPEESEGDDDGRKA